MEHKSITAVQDEIVEDFGLLDGDMETTIFYIMELGAKLPEMTEASKTEDNIVKGCQSKVWLTAREDGGNVYFEADSNTDVTKGLVSLLVRILSGQKASDIVDADLSFIDRIGLQRFIGTQRSNGFGAMIKQMKLYAFAFANKAG